MKTELSAYVITGSRLDGLLAQRLDETRITGINSLEGVIVYTSNGVYYSEIRNKEFPDPIKRDDYTEEIQGLVESITRLSAATDSKATFELEIQRSKIS